MSEHMFEASAKTTFVPNVGSAGIGTLVEVPRTARQPFVVFIRNLAAAKVFVAHSVNALGSPTTLSEAFTLLEGQFMITVLAPGQKLVAGSDPANDGVQGQISYTVFAAPFWMAGIPSG